LEEEVYYMAPPLSWSYTIGEEEGGGDDTIMVERRVGCKICLGPPVKEPQE